MARYLLIVGTRPEAIKLAPVALALDASKAAVQICTTGQHRELAEEALDWFGLRPDLMLGCNSASLDSMAGSLVTAIGASVRELRPDWVIVQGDTTSALAGAIAAHLAGFRLAHVEAGLRSGDRARPWPEESHRKLIAAIADLHFAPTPAAAEALRAERVDPASIHVTGNTAVDALQLLRDETVDLQSKSAPRRVLVTCHRRESFGVGVIGVAGAIKRLASRGDVQILIPLHPNPRAGGALGAALEDHAGVTLMPPLPYPAFIRELARAHLVLTDSGGIQEEAPSFGVPVLVMRDVTERSEGIVAGTARLVGTDPDRIVSEATRLLDDPEAHAAMARAHNPYGDGRAAGRIVRVLNRSA